MTALMLMQIVTAIVTGQQHIHVILLNAQALQEEMVIITQEIIKYPL